MSDKISVKAADVIIILFSLSLTVFSAFKVYVKAADSVQVLIEGQNQKWVFPITADETVEVSGPLGVTVIKLCSGEAWVESSPCKNQLCVSSGILNRYGEFAACLPNMVFLALEGRDEKQEVDITAW